jgi:hypothetical protein
VGAYLLPAMRLYNSYISILIFTQKAMKFQFRLLFSLLFIVSLTGTISAQSDSTHKKVFKHSLGAAAGITTGYGLSYRFWPHVVGVQLAFAPTSNYSQTKVSAGLTFLFKLVQTDKANLFLYQGNHFFYYKDKYYSYWNGNHPASHYLYNGIGMGIEFIIVKRVSFNLMGGYAAYDNFNRFSLTGETGLFFKF